MFTSDQGKPGLFDAFRWLSLAVATLVVVQAALAGRGFMLAKPGWIDVHGIVGNVVFLAGLGLTAIALHGLRRGLLDRADLALSVIMLLLIFAQIGLGYAGRDSHTAASLHWPTGVLITVVAALLLGRSLPRRATPSD